MKNEQTRISLINECFSVDSSMDGHKDVFSLFDIMKITFNVSTTKRIAILKRRIILSITSSRDSSSFCHFYAAVFRVQNVQVSVK